MLLFLLRKNIAQTITGWAVLHGEQKAAHPLKKAYLA